MKDLTNGYRSGVTEVEYGARPTETTFPNLWKPSETVQCNDKPCHDMQKLLEYDSKIFIQVAALSLNLLVAR